MLCEPVTYEIVRVPRVRRDPAGRIEERAAAQRAARAIAQAGNAAALFLHLDEVGGRVARRRRTAPAVVVRAEAEIEQHLRARERVVHVPARSAAGAWSRCPLSGACVAVVPPASIHRRDVARQPLPVVPIHAAPLQPCCSSQKRFSLLCWVICHVRRRLLAIVERVVARLQRRSGRVGPGVRVAGIRRSANIARRRTCRFRTCGRDRRTTAGLS